MGVSSWKAMLSPAVSSLHNKRALETNHQRLTEASLARALSLRKLWKLLSIIYVLLLCLSRPEGKQVRVLLPTHPGRNVSTGGSGVARAAAAPVARSPLRRARILGPL